jgi:hypothetical protein
MRYLPFLLLFFAALGCSENTQPAAAKKSETSGDKQNVAKNGAKLLIQSEPKNRTGIYQSDFKILQPIVVSGKKVDGQHSIELNNQASYTGTTAKCDAESLVIDILHGKPSRSGWQFPRNAKLTYVADGVEMKPIKVIQKSLDEEDGEYWEALISQPSCEAIQKIASAKTAALKVDAAVITLSDSDISAFRDFAAAIGIK